MTAGPLSRRTLVVRGGAVVVAFALGPAAAARASFLPGPPLDAVDPGQVDSYLTVHADGTVTVRTGRVELGQGATTGLALLVAEELDIDPDRLVFARHDTSSSPDTGGTYGSSSIAAAGRRLRSASAAARQALLELGSAALGVPVPSLATARGTVSGGGRSIGYGELVGGRLFSLALPGPILDPGEAPAKPVASYTLVGRSRLPRLDIPAKVAGSYVYVHSVRLPGMLHARLVRPFGQGAYGDGTLAGIVSVDEHPIAGLGDARVVRRGDLLAVVASREYDAIQAAARLRVVYREPPELPGSGNLFGAMRAAEAPARLQATAGDVEPALAAAAHTVSASYAYHYQGHMPVGPTCALADVREGSALVLCNTQDAFLLRAKLSVLLGLPPERVRVQYWEGASTFGNSPARYDAPEAAAVISQLAAAPVRLQYMRWDEHGWDNYGPALLADVRGAVDEEGNISAFDYTAFALPSLATQTDATMQNAGIPLAPPGLGSADALNSGTQYALPNRRVTGRSLPAWNAFLKASALRAPHCPQTCFASEQLVDELAHAAGADPFEFRLRNIQTGQVNDGFDQWRDALTAVADLANWQPRVAASRRGGGPVVRGRGIALGGFAMSQAAVVAELEVHVPTGRIRATHLYAAQVCGLAVYLPGIESQMEGNLIMGASRALKEEVAFDRRRSRALDWVSYPILRFAEAPAVSVRVVQRSDLASTGSGEPASVPVPAALANAFFDATGVRIRTAPLTPGRVRAVLAAAR